MIPRHLIIAVAILLAITLGMGFYVLRMRARVDRTDVSAANTQPVAPPVSGSKAFETGCDSSVQPQWLTRPGLPRSFTLS